jgi:hypothetical protein
MRCDTVQAVLRRFAILTIAACSGAPEPASPTPDVPVRDDVAVWPEASLDVVPALDDVASVDVVVAPRDVPTTLDVEPPAAPIVAPDDRWTWIDVPGSACANGQPTGFGVNLRRTSRDVLIFLQGGGACWDGPSCWGPVSTSFFVATGYQRLQFETDVLRPAMFFLRRLDTQNPFRNDNLVYVPYCTGDVHIGTRVATHQWLGPRLTHHVGARNLALFLRRIAATFPDARRVVLSGDSAGGFGAAFNLPQVQSAFSRVRVSVVDDSGPPIQPAGDRWAQWGRSWGVELPEGCSPACATSIDAMVDVLRTRYADTRFALVSYDRDAVIGTFMGHAPDEFRRRLFTLADRTDRTWPSARYFIAGGLTHVMQAQPMRPRGFDAWVHRFVDGDTTLTSVRP